MVKYKEFIQEKLQKLNNLPKRWQQIIICILVIIIAIIYCFISEEKTKIAVSEKVENENIIATTNDKDEDKIKNSKIIYSMDKDISVIKNPFSFEHEEKSTAEAKAIVDEKQQEDKMNMNNEDVKIKTQQQQISMVNKDEKKTKKTINKEQNVYKLKAILNFNREKVALFSINDKIYRVRQGDMVNDIKILAIGQNNLILRESTGKEIKCPLT